MSLQFTTYDSKNPFTFTELSQLNSILKKNIKEVYGASDVGAFIDSEPRGRTIIVRVSYDIDVSSADSVDNVLGILATRLNEITGKLPLEIEK